MDLKSSRLIESLARPVPRYTSYPTALQFSGDVDRGVYANWLGAIDPASALSLYLHIPYCHALCSYCGCNTKATQRYAPVAAYLDTLLIEAAAVAARLPRDHVVGHIHMGGGSPNILSAADLERLAAELRRTFNVAAGVDLDIEIDPRYFTPEQAEALARIGVTRVSFGVQDFDPTVQAAINRRQPFEMTSRAVSLCRNAGIGSINIDLMYGLPGQHRRRIGETVARVIELQPDRIAVFGYAHLPQRFAHQRLIPADMMPDTLERYRQASRMARLLTDAGYVRIGIDHYVKAGDPLAEGSLRRNFQGYTSDSADQLIGLGASAIGKLAQGFVQNTVPTADYTRLVRDGGLAVVRGRALTQDDTIRAHVIERLMCDLTFDGEALRKRFGDAAAPVIGEARQLVDDTGSGLIEPSPTGFSITEKGRPFARSICARFDAHLNGATGRHSPAV